MNHGFVLLSGLILALAGCAAPRGMSQGRDDVTQTHAARIAGYSLLDQILADEARVGGILLLRSASEPTEQLVRQIAEAAQTARAELAAFADQTPWLRFDRPGLPAVEIAVREAITRQLRHQLLFEGRFERNLLLTQVDATRYVAALARALREQEDDDERRVFLKALAGAWDQWHARALERLAVVGQ